MELMGISEIAQMAGVSRQVVSNWRTRSKNFPAPVAELSSGPVWLKEHIENWLRAKEGKMAKVISFINLKGGVGKTTTTVAIAEFLALEHQKRVLVVDLDPQTNATIALIDEEIWEERDKAGLTLLHMFLDKLERTNRFDIDRAIMKCVSNIKIPRLSLLPSSLGLIELQDQLPLIPGRTNYAVNPVEILKTALYPILDNFDYVLIDCPPNLGLITMNGITISTGYVIPTIPDILSTYGIPSILNRIEKFTDEGGREVPPRGIIISKFRSVDLHRSKLKLLREQADKGDLPPIFDTVIPEAIRIAGSPEFEIPANTLRQKYGYGNNYTIYNNLAQEFIDKCY